MNRWTTFLAAAALASALIAPAAVRAAETAPTAEKPAAKPAEAPKPAAQPHFEGDLAILVRETNLAPEQQAKLAELVAGAKAAAQAWEKQHAAEIESFKKARDAAVAAQDQVALKKAIDDHRALIEDNRRLAREHEAAVLNLLTPDQRVAWHGFALFRDINRQLERLNLSAEQQGKLRPLCNSAARELLAIPAVDSDAGVQAATAILEKLRSAIRDQVLTPEQKVMLEPSAPPAGPAPSPAPGGTGAAKPPAQK